MFLRTSKLAWAQQFFFFFLHLSLSPLSIFHRSSKGLYAAKKRNFYIPTPQSNNPPYCIGPSPFCIRTPDAFYGQIST